MTISYSIDNTAVPNAALKILQRLAKTLRRDTPKKTNDAIELSAARLDEFIAVVRLALMGRFREINPKIIATETEFDRGVDINWVWMRKLLEGWRDAFGHPGLDALPPKLQEAVNLPALRHKARLAGDLHDRLFGAEGTVWVMSNWMVQSETMGTILDVIEDDELAKDLATVVGEELPRLLFGMQEHYEDIVAGRMSRELSPNDNFNELRAQMRWHIDHYKSALETLRDPKDPETFAIVERALRSLKFLIQHARTGVSTEELEELIKDEFVELEFEEDVDDEPPAPVEQSEQDQEPEAADDE